MFNRRTVSRMSLGSVALAAVVQDFFEDLGRGGGVGVPLLLQPLGKLVHEVDRLLVRDVGPALDDIILPLRDPLLAVAAEVLPDHEVPTLVLPGGHGLIVAQPAWETNRFVSAPES